MTSLSRGDWIRGFLNPLYNCDEAEYRLGVNRRDCEYRAGVAILISAIRTVVEAKISLLNINTVPVPYTHLYIYAVYVNLSCNVLVLLEIVCMQYGKCFNKELIDRVSH